MCVFIPQKLLLLKIDYLWHMWYLLRGLSYLSNDVFSPPNYQVWLKQISKPATCCLLRLTPKMNHLTSLMTMGVRVLVSQMSDHQEIKMSPFSPAAGLTCFCNGTHNAPLPHCLSNFSCSSNYQCLTHRFWSYRLEKIVTEWECLNLHEFQVSQ